MMNEDKEEDDGTETDKTNTVTISMIQTETNII